VLCLAPELAALYRKASRKLHKWKNEPRVSFKEPCVYAKLPSRGEKALARVTRAKLLKENLTENYENKKTLLG
jgi:hypothetical protein